MKDAGYHRFKLSEYDCVLLALILTNVVGLQTEAHEPSPLDSHHVVDKAVHLF